MTTDDERLARVGLSRLLEPDDRAVRALIADVGAAAVWAAVVADSEPEVDELARGAGRALARYRALRLSADQAALDLATAQAAGIRLLCPGDAEWPRAFDDLGDAAPVCLWVRGNASADTMSQRAVAVVGSRTATEYGVHVASELAYDLSTTGWTVVSGAAYGIDGAAHRGALAADGVTVAILACGVDIAYPRGHAGLLDRVAATGLVASEWPPGSPPYARRFLWRNRLIAALGSAVVVVEAAARSGAMSTAHYAMDYGRPVLAVPGPITSGMSVGCHALLRDGALCVTSAAEIAEAASPIGSAIADPPRGPAHPRDDLTVDQRRAIEALPARGATTVEQVARGAGLTPVEARQALARLELAGLVERDGAAWRLAAAERARRRAPVGRPP
jgi:DNA processing protein